jgi:hypothetical protein
VPSLAAVLQADSTTQSALRFRVATFEAVNRPSLSGMASLGGVSNNAGSRTPGRARVRSKLFSPSLSVDGRAPALNQTVLPIVQVA